MNRKSNSLDQTKIEDLAFQILGLAKMNWGSIDIGKEPVSLKFAKIASEFAIEDVPVSRLTDIRHIIWSMYWTSEEDVWRKIPCLRDVESPKGAYTL